MAEAPRTVDVLIVGAGQSGLATAKTYLELLPETNLLIIDSKATIGGVWAKETLYPGLKSNNLLGTYEYTDFPMHEGFGVKTDEHIPGEVIHDYFYAFAERYDLLRRIKFNTKVISAEKLGAGWNLVTESWDSSEQAKDSIKQTILCAKLLICTGTTSTPQPMHVKGEESFAAPYINFASLASEAKSLLHDPRIKSISIFGGGKAAYDAVYYFASGGKHVDWIIRKSGHGPSWMSSPYVYLGPFRCWLEMLTVRRVLTWSSPCTWGAADGFGRIRQALHGTAMGRWFVGSFWEKLEGDIIAANGWRRNENIENLIPDASPMWTTRLGILNYPTDIYDYVVTGQIKVHREDIDKITERTVHLSNGDRISTDAFVASTGWAYAPTIEFKPHSMHADLGIPSLSYSKPQKLFWDELDKKADTEIYHQFPQLLSAPSNVDSTSLLVNPFDADEGSQPRLSYTPFRLHRGIVPPGLAAEGDRSLVFLGMMHNISSSIRCEISALWSVAYLTGKLDIDPDTVHWETALSSRFGKRRYPYGLGARFPDFIFDSIPYFDLLLHDLGLMHWRKENMFKEMFAPYVLQDYKGLNREWQEKMAASEKVWDRKI